jgi:hypothetical protein
MTAYFDFFADDSEFNVARELSAKYKHSPILKFKLMFNKIEKQIKEFDQAEFQDDS